ncbi:MAG: hypothetical protein ABIF10_04645 [Candidatus Woesearchaeota archaeon]
MSRRFRKASLSLSINAIVVLILAITILGLGLGFIKKQFTDMSSKFQEVSVEMQKEMTDKIRQSGELLVFNVLDIQVNRGVEQTFYMGLSNTDQTTKCFTVMFKCIKALTTGNSCDSVAGDNVWIGGEVDPGITGDSSPQVSNPWVKVFTLVNIDSGSVGVYPVNIQIGSATQDTYLMEVLEYKSDTEDCDNSPTWSGVAFQRKQFYIKLK